MAESDPLSKMILQPATQSVSLAENATMTERWKGPWSQIKNATSTQRVFNTTLIIGQKRPAFNNGNWDQQTTVPATMASDMKWVITDIRISQEASGDNGILEIAYKAGSPSVDNSDPDSGKKPEKKDTGYQIEDTYSRQWSLAWQSYSQSVLTFSEKPNDIIKFKMNPTGEKDESGNPKWTYWEDSRTNKKGTLSTEKETQIAARYVKGVNPTYHYPVVTLHTEYSLPDGELTENDIGEDLDTICDLPEDCPFSFPENTWEWILNGDKGSLRYDESYTYSEGEEEEPTEKMTRKWKYVRDQTWQGAKKWDPKFYGSDDERWQPIDDPE